MENTESNKRKRKALTITDKVDIINELEKGKSNTIVGREFNLSSSTVSTIWKNRETILKAFDENQIQLKKMRTCKKKDIDEALMDWFKIKRSQNVPINGPILKLQAEKIARLNGDNDFKCSNGWLSRFKKRHNLTYDRVSRESGGVNFKEDNVWINDVWEKLKTEYKNDFIFNIDETEVFYDLMKLNNEAYSGGSFSKERVTALVCTNMSGTEKRKLLVMGNSESPVCLNGVTNLPVKYQVNNNFWMTSEIFLNELIIWDAELRQSNRRILVLVNNCPTHTEFENLTNLKLLFFPTNESSILQPMDQGIIRNLKFQFRKKLVLQFLENSDSGNKISKVSLIEAIRFLAEAWDSVTEDTIKNSFTKFDSHLNDPLNIIENEEEDLSSWLKNNNLNYKFDEVNEYIYSQHALGNEVYIKEEYEEDDKVEYEAEQNIVEHVSSTEALRALNVLQLFYETNPVDYEFFSHLTKMKDAVQEHYLQNRDHVS